MKTWKKVMIVALCVLAVAIATLAILVSYAYYDKYHSRYYTSYPTHLSENIVMVEGWCKDGSFVRLKNVLTGEFISPKFQHVFINDYDKTDSLVVFRTMDDKRGYLNSHTGEIVINAQYDRAWNFSEGLAAILKNGVVTFIREDGELAFDKKFPIKFSDDCNSAGFQFHNGYCAMRSLNNKWGLIDKNGEWHVNPVFVSIDAPAYGYRIVCDGYKYGLMKSDGTLALPVEYDNIRRAGGNIRAFILAKDGIGIEVDTQLNVIAPFICDGIHDIDVMESANENPYIGRYYRYDLGFDSGVLDAKGNVVIPAKYFMVRIVNEDLFEAEITYDGERILLNGKGQIIGGKPITNRKAM